jgi:hypothetical protein
MRMEDGVEAAMRPKGSAGDPIAGDTFGYEMFQQMALFSPVAGMVMCLAPWFMFRSLPVWPPAWRWR